MDGAAIAGAPLSGSDRWTQVFTPCLTADCYSLQRLAEALGRADEPYIRNSAKKILIRLVEDNIRKSESQALVTELHGGKWATGCLDRLHLAHADRRPRLSALFTFRRHTQAIDLPKGGPRGHPSGPSTRARPAAVIAPGGARPHQQSLTSLIRIPRRRNLNPHEVLFLSPPTSTTGETPSRPDKHVL